MTRQITKSTLSLALAGIRKERYRKRNGPAKGKVVELDKMLPELYQLCGWDEKGWPKKGMLEELGLLTN